MTPAEMRDMAARAKLEIAIRDEIIKDHLRTINKIERERDQLRQTLNFNAPTANFEFRHRAAFNLLCRIANHDWLDDPTELRRALDGYVEEARGLSIDQRRDMSGTDHV